jgi:serine/threonine protein kinase
LWSSFPYFSFLTKKKNDRECFIQFDPAERISAKEAMEHPYFDGLDKSQFESALCPFNLIWSQL